MDERNQEATVYIGNLDERTTDAILWELMLQAGPVANIHLPKDRVTQNHQGFGFCEFIQESDADYAVKVMNQIKLFGKPIRVNKASADKKANIEIGAELFIGNLDPLVDEKSLFDTFSAFGTLLTPPKISRDENGMSRGFGFVNFDSFESADAAIEGMNNQFLNNKSINVDYAFKQGQKGEKHGTTAERLLAAKARQNNVSIAPQIPMGLFGAVGPGAPAPPAGFNMGFVVQPSGFQQTGTGQTGYPYGTAPPPGFAPPPPGFSR
ncbi:Spliceosome-associated protein 49 [Neolecta irregularis DAH-3]|uniref:Spliceosome-associated protein 49 n=1 Tax=Neolecta irregularis (strain DAH-3) TaxID=1198029 RepID=A0A1U7LTD8_NEOID|nr:Spliceosome-associated protein 49 [Neolecta irregularis DAH-3]|eukprot:OLL25781.1 Spliceosome-associated protein 49 [Neolecta irregularis DAH-3]